MRAYEFINEVVSLKGQPPKTVWKGDVDTEGDQVDVGVWKDPTGREVRNLFQKDGKGGAELLFDRQTASGQPSFNVTHSGKGASPAIMSGVVQNIQIYLKQNPDVKTVTFTSSDASRTRLYNAMIDRLAPQLGMVGTAQYDADLERTTYNLRNAEPGERHEPLKTQRPKRPAPEPPRPKDPNSPGVDLTRPPRNRPSAQPQGGGGSNKMPTPSIPFSPGSGGGGGMHDMNPLKIPFSEQASHTD
jgi:hypothetical protein